jgi:hypothetical protein
MRTGSVEVSIGAINLMKIDSLLTPELDLFALETKTRKMVHDLLSPMIEKMNHERGRLSQFNERANYMDERISQLEHIHGIKEKRPKVFEEI